MTEVLACSDCYARSAGSTYLLIGMLASIAILALTVSLAWRRRRGARSRATILLTGVVGLLIAIGLVLPAWQISGWRSQAQGGKYELICGSAIHASLRGWTEPAGDANEAGDRAYCLRWGRFNVHLADGVLGMSALLSVAFLAFTASRRRDGDSLQPTLATA